MTDKQQINAGRLTLVVSVGTLLSILAAAIWVGQKCNEIKTHMEMDWTLYNQAKWVADTEQKNPSWKAGDVFASRRE